MTYLRREVTKDVFINVGDKWIVCTKKEWGGNGISFQVTIVEILQNSIKLAGIVGRTVTYAIDSILFLDLLEESTINCSIVKED